MIAYEGIRIDLVAREVWVRGEPIRLVQRDFDLLTLLASHPNHAFTRAELLRDVWGDAGRREHEEIVTSQIVRLRRAIEEDPNAPRWLHTVAGVGYRFDPDGKARPVAIRPLLGTACPS